jgi:hypothetical protein
LVASTGPPDRSGSAALLRVRGLGIVLGLERCEVGGDLARARAPEAQLARVEAERVGDLEPDHFGLGQAAGAELAAGHLAFVGLHHPHPGLAQPLDVARRRGVLPHPHVHRRHREHGLVGGEDQRGGEIVGDPRGHLGEEVGGRRADHHEVGLAAELDVADLGFAVGIPQRGVDRVAAERGEAHRGDELRAPVGQHAGHLAAALADQAHELAGLVGGDAAAHDQQDSRCDHPAVLYSHGQIPSFANLVIAGSESQPKADLPSDG